MYLSSLVNLRKNWHFSDTILDYFLSLSVSLICNFKMAEKNKENWVWQWKSNNDPWSTTEEPKWTNYEHTDNEIIENAYRKKEKQAKLAHHNIDFNKKIQISQSDATKQRPIRRILLESPKFVPRERFLVEQKPVKAFSHEFNHFCLLTAEWLYRNKDRLNVGYAVWVEEAAAGIIEEGNQLDVQAKGEGAHLAEKLRAVKNKSLDEIVKCCIYLYTLETFLVYKVNEALRNGDLSKVDTYGAYCYFLSFLNDMKSLELKYHTQQVFRGMLLPEEILDMYKASVDKYVAWAQFSSTSKNRSVAEDFSKAKENLHSVVFIIKFIGHSRYGCGIDISALSAEPKEEEILLQPGTNFRVDKMEYDQKTNRHIFYIIVV